MIKKLKVDIKEKMKQLSECEKKQGKLQNTLPLKNYKNNPY